jgi:bla regulator protein blaR1
MSLPFALRLAAWTATQFAWQGAIVAAVVLIAMRLLSRRTAIPRYRLALSGLCALVMLPPLTFAAGQWSALSAAVELPVPPAVAPPGVWWASLAIVGWMVGLVVLGGRLARDWWRLRVVISDATDERALEGRVRALAARLGMKRMPGILESSAVATPLAGGWRLPVIVLPAGMTTVLPDDELSAVLLHELAHIRRHDYAINILQRCAEALLWLHPAVWIISRMARMEREHRCDEEAVRASGAPISLARALVALEERLAAPALALGGSGGELRSRVLRILQRNAESPPRARMAPIATVLTVAVTGMIAASAAMAGSDRTLAAAAPVLTIRGADPAGRFTLSIVGGKLRSASLDGKRLSGKRLRQRGATLSLLDPHGRSQLTLRLARDGHGVDWEPRSSTAHARSDR